MEMKGADLEPIAHKTSQLPLLMHQNSPQTLPASAALASDPKPNAIPFMLFPNSGTKRMAAAI